jgi:hypothetical protein
MGTSKVYTCQTSDDGFRVRVIDSILSQPVDLDCKFPESYLNGGNTTPIRTTKPKFRCGIVCSSKSSYTHKAIRPFEISDWISGVHVILSISCEDSTFTASGTIVASRYLLTAASNVYRREINREVDRRDIKILAQNDSRESISKIQVIEICYSKKYPTTGEDDLALLLLDSDIGAISGSFGLKVYEDEHGLSKSLCLCGYETLEESQHEYKFPREADSNVDISSGFINCRFSIRNHLIGSVFYYQESYKYYVVGLLVQPLCSNPETLRVLHLSSDRIQKVEKWIKKCSIKYNIITSLDLSLFPYSTHNIPLNLKSLGALDTLISLDLSRNSLGHKGAKAIAKLTFKSLRSLNLERNDIGCKGAREIARGSLGAITHLKLGENEIGSKGAKGLSFGKLKSLIELDLQYNKIGDEGAIFISRGNFTGLAVLNLSKNELGPIAAKVLVTGNLLNLISLNLSCNQIGNDGALILSKGNTVKLQALDVSSNGIGIEGAAALSYGRLSEMNQLNLERNNIREKTAVRLSRRYTRNLSDAGIKRSSSQDIII